MEHLGLESMKSSKTGQYFFECVTDCVEKNALSWTKMACITTIETKAFTDKTLIEQVEIRTIRW